MKKLLSLFVFKVALCGMVFAQCVGTGYFTDSGQNLSVSSDSLGVALADLDGDGDIDAFLAIGANKVWLNDGSGNFTDSGQNLGSSYSLNVALGDLDGDGDLDAFVVNYYAQPNKVWLNDGSGNFTDSGQNLGGSYSSGIALADLDGDGDMDAFVANSGQSNKVWLNDGAGNFTDSGQNLGSSYSTDVALGDLDGDGEVDAFVANSGDNKVWLNDGSGNFTDSGQNLGGSYSHGFALSDLDGDGDLDVFVGNWNQSNTVWLNDGSSNFTDSGQNLGSNKSMDVALGDLDGDGDMDIFVENDRQANKVWLNDGSGNFTDSGQNLGGSTFALADLDGDGDLDAFVANWDYPDNKVLINLDPIITLTMSSGTASCSGICDGSATVSASGNYPPYTYLWNASAQTDFIATGLCSGNYSVTVTDTFGCVTVVDSVEVTDIVPSISLTMSSGTATCSGICDGIATVSALGNYPPFTYLWNDPSSQTTSTATGLCASNYSVTVTDAFGCVTVVDSVEVTDVVPTISLSMSSGTATCSGICDGTATVSASGNYPPFTYLWNDSSSQTTSTAMGLCSGYHTVTVTDAYSCTTSVDSIEVTDVVPSISLTMSSGTATCSGICDGTATVSTSGNYPPFTYLWNDSSSQTTSTAMGLCSGYHTVTVTDANACTTSVDSVQVIDIVPTITTSMSSTPVQCSICDGTTSVSASGNYTPMTYLWEDGQTTATATGLCSGSHTVTVTDAHSCTTKIDSVTISTYAFPTDSICLITVDSTSTHNVLIWEKPLSQGIDSFRIYRDVLGNYVHVGSVAYDSVSMYTDTSSNINPQITSYRYKISILDTCGNESVLSDHHETIHLQVSYGQTNNLIWDDYEGFPYSFYIIYRKSQGMSGFAPIYSLSATSNTWTDIAPPVGNNKYFVAVDKGGFCNPTLMRDGRSPIGQSVSNIEEDAGAATSIDKNTYGLVSVYPNPFDRSTTITFNNTDGSYDLAVYNLLGNRVKVIENIVSDRVILEKGDLTSGVYFIELRSETQTLKGKVLIE